MPDLQPDAIPDLRAHLLSDVLPFWARHGVDRDYGGFITHLGRTGAAADSSEKSLVMQARMIYSFAAGAEIGGPREWLNLADQGLRFLVGYLRDHEYDGWYWSVTRRGGTRDDSKRTYGHAFAAYALAEYARVMEDSQALASAIHSASVIADCLADGEHGGVIEACDRAWRPLDTAHTMGTHLHYLEALLALDQASGDVRLRERARSICDLIVTRMVESDQRCALEKFYPDWRHNSELGHGVDYGHNLEAAWLLLRVDRAESTPAYRDTARDFLEYVLRFGLDTRHGGVFSRGPLGRPAAVREKIWWVQTEAIVAFLLGYLVLEDRRYWDAFLNVAGFCLRCLHDGEHGEWFASTEEDGTPRDTYKGSGWKSAYHITQACTYAHRYLREIGEAQSAPE